MLSIFDIYKIGVGPSSSHTNGPMIAGYRFVQQLLPQLNKVARIQVDLYGSLSLTGKGHHTDRATLLGLMGNQPATIKIGDANQTLREALQTGKLRLNGQHDIAFDYHQDLLFHQDNLPLHEMV